MQLVRALEGKLVMFFSFCLQKHVPIAHSAMLEGKPRTINTSNGWSSSVKAKREFMKNKQITGNVNQGQWSNYKHCCAIPRAVKKKTKRFGFEHWSLRNEGMDKNPKHQPFRARLINGVKLTRCERKMMSPLHSCPSFLYWFMFLWPQSTDLELTSFSLHTNMHYDPWYVRACTAYED